MDEKENLAIQEATNKANKRELSLDDAIKLTSEFSHSHQAQCLLGFVYFQKDDYKKCIKQIKKSFSYGKSTTAYNLYAQAYMKMNQKEEAKDAFLEALKINKNDLLTLTNYANFLGQAGELSESVAIVKRLTLAIPNDINLKTKLIQMYHSMADFKSAIDYLKSVIKDFPNEFIFHHLLGLSYFQSDKKEEAKESFEAAIKINPNSSKSYFNLAIYNYENKDYEEAIPLLHKVIEIEPNWTKPYVQMCYVLYNQKEFSSFHKFLEDNFEKLKNSIEISSLCELIALQEDKESKHPFCPEPINYIKEFHIKDYLQDHDNFIEKLIDDINQIEFSEGYAPNSGKSQINGTQTAGNIFNRQSPMLSELNKFINMAIEDYKKEYSSANITMINDFPIDYNLWGWCTKFDKGSGNHFSHIHPTGWVSGAFYLNVPKDIKKDEACIQFDLQGSLPLVNNKVIVEKKTIAPEVGKLIIFPSSLYHCTTPFSSKSLRQAINFDLVSPYAND